MKRFENIEMKAYTSFKAGGKAAELLILDSIEELQQVLADLSKSGNPYIILGNGSNTLIKDEGYDGTVIKLGEAFDKIHVEGDQMICGCSALLSSAAKAALGADLTGFEFASGIPGSVGGAVFMNAGAYRGEMKDIVKEVCLVKRDGSKVTRVQCQDMAFAYRHSCLEESGDVAVSVTFQLTKGKHDEIASKMQDLMRRRNEKQPVQYPSAGSFFKRPEGYFAGKLIEDAGLKGFSSGGAQVSELHSGFIINKGGASATDILKVMETVQNTVFDKFGVKLEPEVRIIGK